MSTNHKQPTVSVLLPVFNGAASVLRALNSVSRQSFVDHEIIVIDDGSTDATAEIIDSAAQSDSRIVCLRNQTNLGIQHALNLGLKHARGEFIARIDADDEWVDADKLARQADFLKDNPDVVCVGTGAIVTDGDGQEILRYLKPISDQDIRNSILGKNCFVHSSVLIRKDPLLQAGGYDESVDCLHVEDYDLWLRLGQVGHLANLPIYGVKYGSSPEQISTKHRVVQYRKNIRLMNRYRKHYPGYFKALIRNHLRLYLYGYGNLGEIRCRLSKILR